MLERQRDTKSFKARNLWTMKGTTKRHFKLSTPNGLSKFQNTKLKRCSTSFENLQDAVLTPLDKMSKLKLKVPDAPKKSKRRTFAPVVFRLPRLD